MRKSPRLLASTAATAVLWASFAVQGHKDSSSPERLGAGRDPIEFITPPDLGAEQHRYLGEQAINGCDLEQAQLELSLRVIDGASFKARVFAQRSGAPRKTIAFNSGEVITNGIALTCNGRLKAIAGILDARRAIRDTNYNPVRLIKAGDKQAECYLTGSSRSDCTGKQAPTTVVTMRLPQESLRLFGNDRAGFFLDEFGQWEGVASARGSASYHLEGPLRELNPIAHPPKPIIGNHAPQSYS